MVTHILLWTLGALSFVAALMVSVALHEAGHMIAAKKFGLKVGQYFVGFGKTIWSFKKGETEYGVKMLPLGGYVSIEDTAREEDSIERASLSYVAPWKRQIVFLAGPLVNIILGFALCFGFFMATPALKTTGLVNTVPECTSENVNRCGASEVGILAGDQIINVNGKDVALGDDIKEYMADYKESVITVQRGNEVLTFTAPTPEGVLGVQIKTETSDRSATESVNETFGIITGTLKSITQVPQNLTHNVSILFGEERHEESLSGIVSIGKVYGDVAATDQMEQRSKVEMLIYMTGAFNLGLGFINLLPILPLDGGRMLIAFLDSIKNFTRKIQSKAYAPINPKIVERLGFVGFIAVFGFMFIVIASDIVSPVNIFGK